jgi:phosphoglycerate dehydrogenase-like enzyme
MQHRVGITDDFLLADGTLSFPGYDLGPLRDNPRVTLCRVPSGTELLGADLASVDVLISVPMTAAITRASLSDAQNLAGIVRVGVGCDDVDLAACTDAGVAVVVPSDAVRRPTAVAALTLILALATRLLDKDRLTRAGPADWHRRASLRGSNLTGRVLGLVGCGSIGSDLAALVRPLDMRVIAFDPALSDREAAQRNIERLPLDEVLARSDFISIHCPLTAATRGLIDAAALARMRAGSYLVNTARGGIVDQAALRAALLSGHLAGAGLDVFDPEPLPADDPLLSTPGVLLSAHALNWTHELDADLAALNVQAVIDLLAGRVPGRIMNPDVVQSAAFASKLARLAAASAAVGTLA